MLIFKSYRGSKVHGTYTKNSDDIDTIGVRIAPINHYFGFTELKTKEFQEGEIDDVTYEFKKFMTLLKKSNPNVLATLWLEDKYILHKSDYWDQIRDNRKMFVSNQAYRAFKGYATSQLRRLGRPNTDQAYMGKKRREKFEKFGYDCKNASHFILLARQGAEFLRTGEMLPHRGEIDAQELIDIKSGLWTKDKVLRVGKDLLQDLDEAYSESTLPEVPSEKIETLTIEILEDYFGI